MFDPSIGKWISEDPEGFAAGDANLYRYVANGPTDGVDSTGMAPDNSKPRLSALDGFLRDLNAPRLPTVAGGSRAKPNTVYTQNPDGTFTEGGEPNLKYKMIVVHLKNGATIYYQPTSQPEYRPPNATTDIPDIYLPKGLLDKGVRIPKYEPPVTNPFGKPKPKDLPTLLQPPPGEDLIPPGIQVPIEKK